MKVIFLLFILNTFYIMFNTSAYADISQNNTYILHMKVNTDGDQGYQFYTKPIKRIIQTLSPIPNPALAFSPTPIPLPRTKISVGYTDTEPVTDFSFTISDNMINLSPLLPGDVLTRENNLSVQGDPSYMYTIFSYENHQLNNEKKVIIPNTTCDDGTCSRIKASTWTNVLTYGFGYRCESNTGHDCDSTFQNQDSYRQFSDMSLKEAQTSLAAGITSQRKKETITYKLNIAGSQMPGYYKNIITYLAIPMY